MADRLYPRVRPLTILKRKSIYLVVFSAAIAISGQFALRAYSTPGLAGRWFLFTAAGLVYLVYLFKKLLPLNQKQGASGEILPNLGAGTILTISRGVLVSMLAGFLLSPKPPGLLAWLPAILYWLANLTDFLDGYIARRSNYETRLGEALDMALDGYGVLVAAVLVVQYGQVPAWYLPVGLARYFFILGIALRKKSGKPVFTLPPSTRRRAFAGLQMGFLGVMLMPLFSPPGTFWAAAVFGLMFLVGFLVDWLYISGALTQEDLGRAVRAYASPIRASILSLRLITSGLLAWTVWEQAVKILPIGAAQTVRHAAPGAHFLTGMLLLELLLLVLLLSGSAGRIAALAVLVVQGLHQITGPLTIPQVLLVLASAGVFFLGTGPISLWKPEDRLIFRRAGEP